VSTRKLELLEEALDEAEEAARWYARRSTLASEAFSEELETALDQIVSSPATWPTYDSGTRRYLLRRFPYAVVYRVTADRIVVIAIAHTSRRPFYWQERLRG
jgi:plasmid stabilization system protein ParE